MPNPATDKLTVCLVNDDINEGMIDITDMNGRTVYQMVQQDLPMSAVIDLSGLEKGTYLLTFTTDDLRTTKDSLLSNATIG